MINSGWRSHIVPLWINLGLVSAYSECLIGFGLQGLDPFVSSDWEGLPVCDGSLASAVVDTNRCTTSYTYACLWSVVDCATDTDDATCTCQACGGVRSDVDAYMLELPIWDRARCAIFAMEQGGFDVSPCVEAIVDTKSMPGVTEEWTAPAVDRITCTAIEEGIYDDDDACIHPGTPRFAAEAFDDYNATVLSSEECLIGFGLQGLDPFVSSDWEGLPVCDSTIASAVVDTNRCTTSYTYACLWSVVDCATNSDDATCTCQACGGVRSDVDEYMLELPIWDRARCAIFAMEQGGFDVTPCVEAIVDTKSMPGVTEEWTAPAVDRITCTAIEEGIYDDDDACIHPGTPRFAAEAFDDNTATLLSSEECLIGFGLQGLDPFVSSDWEGLPICDGSLASAVVDTNRCTTSYTYACLWSVVDCATNSDDATCTCQACGGVRSDLDAYMLELPIWDRARCAIFAMEEGGFDVTPCVEAIVDTKSMPGVVDEWTALAVDQATCTAIEEGIYDDDDACVHPGTRRFAAEAFGDDASSLTTPAPGAGETPAPLSSTDSVAPVENVTRAPESPSAPAPTASSGDENEGPTGMTPTASDGESFDEASVGGAGDVNVYTGEDDGLAVWAEVLIGIASLGLLAFGTWVGYKTYRSQNRQEQAVSSYT